MGPNWECTWKSYIATDGSTNDAVMLYGAGGGEIQFTNLDGTAPNYYYNLRLLALTDTNGNLSGFELFYPSGAKDVYGFLVTDTNGTVSQAYLSQKMDAQGRTTGFIYAPYDPVTHAVVQLNQVLDPDGRTNTLSYTNNGNYNCLISQVQDPFGHTAHFAYDADGNLTNVTDVAGISSSFGYADVAVGTDRLGYVTNRWLDQLTTPYGTTSFTFTDNNLEDSDVVNRSVVITEPNGSHQMFVHRGLTTFINSIFDTSNVPTSTPDGSALDDGGDDWLMIYRNSFYWGRQQFANLSPTFLATGATNWDLTQLSTNDYRKARWQKWLHSTDGGQSDALSMEQDPSPNGVVAGEMTWFTYPNQIIAPYYQGSSALPTLIIKVLPDGSQWYQQYQVDQWGNRTNVISTYTSSDGSVGTRTNSYVYADNGIDLLNIIGPDEVPTGSYGYDSQHQVLFMTNALGEVTLYTYNGNQQTTSISLPSGLVTTNLYGADGFLAQQIVVGFSTNSYTYTNGLVSSHTDERGLTVANSWDALQRLTRVAYPDSTSIDYTYNKLDLAKVVDRLGFTNAYGYNAIRQKVAETNALGSVTRYEYCECGALEALTDALGHVTHFTHDNQGNVSDVVYPDGYSVTNQYNLLRQLTQHTDSSGAVLSYTFNNQGQQTTISNAVGQVAAYGYDINDRMTNSVDANGVSVSLNYDSLGRMLNRNYPDGGVEQFGYSPAIASPTRFTNQIGNVTVYSYDAMNRKTSEVHAGVTTNQFAYNGAGDLVTLTDGRNQTTAWRYDTFGRVTNKLDTLNHALFNYAYDADSRLTNRWTPEMGNTFYAYDAVGNLTQIRYPQLTNFYAYDALNRLTNMVDSVGTTHCTYDAAGQLLSSGGLWSGDTLSLGYTNRLRASLDVGSTWSQHYSYDSARRLYALSSPAGAFGYGYAVAPASPLVSTINLPNGATITNGYDVVARLTQTSLNNHWGHTLDGYAYQYDLLGERTNLTRNLGVTASSITVGYDRIGQLTSWGAMETNGAARLNEQLAWAYDAAGNLRTRTNGALVQTFTVDAMNELTNVSRTGAFTLGGATPAPATNVTVNGQVAQMYSDFTFARTNLTLANGQNNFTNIAVNKYGVKATNTLTANLPQSVILEYDCNGNLTNDGLRSIAYDTENQLTNVTADNLFKKEFAYDGLNRLRIKREFVWLGSVWLKTNEIRYIWDGDVIVQLSNSNNGATMTLTRGIDFSGSMQGAGGIGGLLAMTEASGTSSYYHADGNGNITAMIGAQENIVARREYDAFGRTINLTGSKAVINPFWFSSQLYDEATDFYYYKYRAYSPTLQRWLNRDPIKEWGGYNLYRMVHNNCLKYYDAFGLQTIPGGGEYWEEPWMEPTTPAGYACQAYLALADNNGWFDPCDDVKPPQNPDWSNLCLRQAPTPPTPPKKPAPPTPPPYGKSCVNCNVNSPPVLASPPPQPPPPIHINFPFYSGPARNSTLF